MSVGRGGDLGSVNGTLFIVVRSHTADPQCQHIKYGTLYHDDIDVSELYPP